MPSAIDEKRTEKLQIMLGETELKALDEWRFEHRMPTRAAAIRELLRRGLISSSQFDEPETEDATTRDFSVVDEKVKEVVFGDDEAVG